MRDDDLDEEMRELWRTESRDHLQGLEEALLFLEHDPGDEEGLRSAARETHNLKGAARIMGFEAIEELAHASEDVLHEATDRGRLGGPQLEALLEALDALRDLVEAASAGDPASADVDVEGLVDELAGASADPARDTARAEPRPSEEGSDPLERARAHRIETIRVDPGRLDQLLRRANELTETVGRLDEIGAEVDESRTFVEGLSRTIREELPAGTEAPVSQAMRRDVDRLEARLERLADRLEADSTRLRTLAEAIEDRVQESRLLPMSTTFDLFERGVRDLARSQGKRVDLRIEGETVRADKRVLEQLKDPLMHMIRNAVDHGIEPPEEREAAGKDPVGTVRLAAKRTPETIAVEVEDDGRGIDPDEIRELARERGLVPAAEIDRLGDGEVLDLVFDAGFTTEKGATEVSGRGIGLESVANTIDQLHGSVHLDSTPGEGTRIAVEVPVEISTMNVLLVRLGPNAYAIPVDPIVRVLNVAREDLDASGDVVTVDLDGPVPVADTARALGLGGPDPAPFEGGSMPCVVVRARGERLGLLVDELLGETEIVVEPLGGVLRRVHAVTGASVLGDGSVCVVLEPVEVAQRVRETGDRLPAGLVGDEPEGARVLVVEDAERERRRLRRRLEAAGFEVVEAERGGDGLARLEREPVDAVVADASAPDLDGIDLARRIREDPDREEMPVVIVASGENAGEDGTQRALSAGADAFIPTDAVDRRELVATLEELIA